MRRTVFLATAVLAACNAGSNTSSLSLGARSSAASAQPAATASAPATALTRVRVAVQKIELRNRTNDRRAEIALGPVLINLTAADLSDGKVHRVLDSSIPAGTYDKIEFEIHPLERATNDAAADDLVNQHASAIIEGTFNGQPFTFVTALEAEQEFEGNFVVTDKSSNVTFDVDTTSWFVKDGVALDPRDAANRAAIEANLRRSINAFQDDDELGHENHDIDDDNGDDRDGGNSGLGGGDDDGGGAGGGGDDGSGHH